MTGRPGMARGGRLCALLLVALGLLLSACGDRYRAYNPAYADPGQSPPPTPQRKPAPPPGFSPLTLDQEATLAQTGAVETQGLAPLAATPRSTPAVQSIGAAQPGQAIQRVATIPSDGRYRVHAGETLYAVARRFGLPLRSLIDANSLAPPYYLRRGQQLVIPRPRLHRVMAGETLYAVSRANRVQVSAVVRLNGLRAPYTIVPGQQLVLPSVRQAAPLAASPAAPLAKTTTTAKTVEAPRQQSAAAQAAKEIPRPAKKPSVRPVAAAAIPVPPARQSGKFLWPIEGKVISRFGPRDGGQHNDGINILAPRGAPVRAAENGVVAYAGEDLQGFGSLLLIKHADGWVSAYAHNDGLLVKRGETVRRGQTIARVGSSGSVARPQLHFELRRGTDAVNPETLLTRRSSARLQ